MSHVIRVDDEVFQHIQANSAALVDNANSTLRRLLGLDADSQHSGRRKVDGALKSLLDAGLLQVGDRLEWSRPRLGALHGCVVDESGRLVTEDGAEYVSPSGAAVAVGGGGSQPGWNVWTQVRSGKTLDQLRAAMRAGATSAGDLEPDWRIRVEQVLKALPHGTWTAYGDLAELVDRHPREVGNYLAGSRIENGYRVLQHTGKVSPQFRWAKGEDSNVYERLRDAGVRLLPSLLADPTQRLRVVDLQALEANS